MRVISRHRLPRPYRQVMVGLWCAPALLLFVALLIAHGPRLLHPGVLVPLLLMALPAWYVWQEGVDVTEAGLRIRVGGWRYRDFSQLSTWVLDQRRGRRVLVVWDHHQRRVLQCHTAHLTNIGVLMRSLKQSVRYRHWLT